ncbi:hypothetical protein ACQCVE_09260 [Metabacillus sp. 113a]|uniref:hypothetical protein n=1 Tax=Metabacillus sp. 113a TaxID=3404706 RepID=UPI003CE8D204
MGETDRFNILGFFRNGCRVWTCKLIEMKSKGRLRICVGRCEAGGGIKQGRTWILFAEGSTFLHERISQRDKTGENLDKAAPGIGVFWDISAIFGIYRPFLGYIDHISDISAIF